MFGDIASISKTKNKELFEIGKAAHIAEITVSTADAVMKTFSSLSGVPIVGPALATAAAAAAGIAGATELAIAQGAQFSAATGFYNDRSESMIGTFRPREVVIPQRFSDLLASGRISLHGGDTDNSSGGDIINISAGNKSIEQVLLEVKSHLNNKRGGRMVRSDGTPNW